VKAAGRGWPSFGSIGRTSRGRWLFACVAVATFGAVAAALVSQYAYGMQPCPWCVLERLLFVAIGVFALLGLVWRGALGTRVAAAFASVLALAGFAAAMWQHFVAAKSTSCNLTLADRIMTATQLDQLVPSVFESRVSCADAAVTLAGIPYDFLAGALFALVAIAMVRTLRLGA
jgi:disulfide bond formation protein DsbB